MSKSLGLVDNQFGTAVSVLYATYTTFEPVCELSDDRGQISVDGRDANLLKIVTPKILSRSANLPPYKKL